MNRIVTLWRRIPHWLIDIAAIGLAVADAFINNTYASPHAFALVAIACIGLLFRRRFPLFAFVLTLPGSITQDLVVAPIIALFTLSRLSRRRWLLVVCGLLFAAAGTVPWPIRSLPYLSSSSLALFFTYQLGLAAAPVLLGQLMQAREDLARRLLEVEQTREREQVLYAESVLARERSALAREMHDVVSHQVSLIAVQAGALQVTASSDTERDGAEAIRQLSVTTLAELRTMVGLLRLNGGGGTSLQPQPTLADLHRLVDSSRMPVTLSGALPEDVAATTQRALYRAVQEGLTNARKYAPDAAVTVDLFSGPDAVGVSVENAPSSTAPLPLPGSGTGLLGLRERAEHLGGTLEAGPTSAGGFRVRMSVPRAPATLPVQLP
jgi:signal transduction histidine kinase